MRRPNLFPHPFNKHSRRRAAAIVALLFVLVDSYLAGSCGTLVGQVAQLDGGIFEVGDIVDNLIKTPDLREVRVLRGVFPDETHVWFDWTLVLTNPY